MVGCTVSGKLVLLSITANGSGPASPGAASSNRSSTTTFGSSGCGVRPERDRGLLIVLLEDRVLVRRLTTEGEVAVAYSGRSAKLSGVTTTL